VHIEALNITHGATTIVAPSTKRSYLQLPAEPSFYVCLPGKTDPSAAPPGLFYLYTSLKKKNTDPSAAPPGLFYLYTRSLLPVY